MKNALLVEITQLTCLVQNYFLFFFLPCELLGWFLQYALCPHLFVLCSTASVSSHITINTHSIAS